MRNLSMCPGCGGIFRGTAFQRSNPRKKFVVKSPDDLAKRFGQPVICQGCGFELVGWGK